MPLGTLMVFDVPALMVLSYENQKVMQRLSEASSSIDVFCDVHSSYHYGKH